ncbi:MAG: 3-phosphoshikimate 1-carboxyvinyltransferase [Gemmatimonadales bacterium]|nr:3-phosphoshikimate 1-carboxyvinyltransferase [Gemmatimonadales bacterium]
MHGHRVGGVHRVPGDKSITHRALMIAAISPGRSSISGALTALDARSTASVLRQLGAGISPLRTESRVTVTGRRVLGAPDSVLHCGNSGTTARLMLGILAAHGFEARLTGDSSLRRRPMGRVASPLVAMGANILLGSVGGLPITIRGGALGSIDWALPVASAQVKSAILLAAALAGVNARINEPGDSRDHTERMLTAFGFEVDRVGHAITFRPTGRFTPFEIDVPGDPSSAIFMVGAALLATGGDAEITDVGLNPTRIGAIAVLQRMGARIEVAATGNQAGEPVGRLVVTPSQLAATTVPAHEVPGLIDEIPMLACLAARAVGTTRFCGVGELRVKESDRLLLIAANLTAIGGNATIEGDDLVVEGSDRPCAGTVRTDGDHRIAMAFMVLATEPRNRIVVDNPGSAAVSFPGFPAALAALFQERT